jgi:hypothetical protein
MIRSLRIFPLLALFAVTFVTTGAGRFAHERVEHSPDEHHSSENHDAVGVVPDEEDGHGMPCDDEPSPSRHSDHRACATCVMLAAIGKGGLAPPSARVALVIDTGRPAAARPSSFCLPSAPTLAAASPRGPPAV